MMPWCCPSGQRAFPWAMLSGRPGRCGSLGMVHRVVFLALLAGFVAPAKGSVSCDTYDEDQDDCAADSDCVWVAHSVLRL